MSSNPGSDLQQRLQRRVDECAAEIAVTPGLCNAGRAVAIDDLDCIGSDQALAMLERDGGVGFRLIPAERTGDLTAGFGRRGYRLDWWDTFTAPGAAARAAAGPLAAAGPPPGFRLVTRGSADGDAAFEPMRAFLVEHGIAPFSTATLAGRWSPASAFVVVDAAGAVAATAFTYRPHNRFSRYRDHAWAGLVAVAPAHRGRRLGVYVNACAVAAAVETLGATTVYEQVGATNVVSRRMVEACGLALDPGLKSGLATISAAAFTR